MKNSLSIAYAVKRRAAQKKMAQGGMTDDSESAEMLARGGFPHRMAEGGEAENNDVDPIIQKISNDANKDLNESLLSKIKRNILHKGQQSQKLAQGGMVNGKEMYSEDHPSIMHMDAKSIARKIAMRKMADGGQVQDYGQVSNSHEDAAKKSVSSGLGGSDGMSAHEKHMAALKAINSSNGYAQGGEVDDDFLSDEENTALPDEESQDMMMEEQPSRKGMLSKIMRGLHAKHMGK